MRKMLFTLLCLLCLLPAAALADAFTFAEQGASCKIDGSKYTIITPVNIESRTSWLTAKGTTADAVLADFAQRGVLLQAWSSDGDVCIEISAIHDNYGEQYYDINKVTETERKNYRLGHSSDKTGEWRAQGYDYSDAVWKNYKNGGRFLQLVYARTFNGQSYRGYARKTIRNGWHIHVDYQVYGRSLKKTSDTKALEDIMNSWTFNEVSSRPATSATRLIFTSTPPQETNTGKFTVSGTGSTGLKILGVVMRSSTRDTQTFETVTDSKGKFSMNVTLPKEGFWLMTYQVYNGEVLLEEGAFDPITFDDMLLPVSLNTQLPESMTLTGNSLTISGTTMKQTKVQCYVDGRYDKQITTNNSGGFSFTIDTSTEGIYNITLVFQKKNYDDRRFRCVGTRVYTEEDRKEAIRNEVIKPTYDKLVKKMQDYRGQYMVYTLHIKEISPAANGYLTFAGMSKTKSGVYKDLMVIRTSEMPVWNAGTQVRMYLKCLGAYDIYSDDGIESYPYFDLQWID